MKKLFTLVSIMFFISFACYTQVTKKPIKSSEENIGHEISPYDGTRQGGNNIGNATIINTLPYSNTGTTNGYSDNYNGNCGWDGGSRDVVYRYNPTVDEIVTISLCGSSFDTNFMFLRTLQTIYLQDGVTMIIVAVEQVAN